eukprot:symbB.v1.2.023522.t1/scaffold2155.1/size87741/3
MGCRNGRQRRTRAANGVVANGAGSVKRFLKGQREPKRRETRGFTARERKQGMREAYRRDVPFDWHL